MISCDHAQNLFEAYLNDEVPASLVAVVPSVSPEPASPDDTVGPHDADPTTRVNKTSRVPMSRSYSVLSGQESHLDEVDQAVDGGLQIGIACRLDATPGAARSVEVE